MTIEQKAKRYDEALWKAGELYQPSYSALLEEIFPELIKYNDEKVRGAIIHFISHTPTVPIGRINKETMLAWLEKQSKPTDINPSEFDLCLNKLLKQFETLPKEELASSLSFYLNVVQNDGTYREEKQGERKPQRMISAEAKEAMYGKPTAWSEEDKKRIQRISDFIWKNRKGDTDDIYQQEQDVKWLKSLRLQKQWKPSDEQMEALKEACDEHWEPDGLDPLYTLYQELKKLREE